MISINQKMKMKKYSINVNKNEKDKIQSKKLMNLNIGETSTILNYNLLMEPFNYTYDDILLNQNEINTFTKMDKKENEEKDITDCGEIDSLKNYLFLKGIKCHTFFVTLNRDYNILAFDTITPSNLSIIIKNYLSEIRNINHKSNNDNYYRRKNEVYFYINQLPSDFRKVYRIK